MPDFCPAIEGWFSEKFVTPAPIQKLAWPRIRAGKSCLLLAPTGSGKTFASFLTIIDSLARLGLAGKLEDTIYAVYITPLKALGNDIRRNLIQPLEEIRAQNPDFPDIRVAIRTGDTTQAERAKMTRNPPHILITTPESLFLLLGSKRIAWALESVRTVIVDEVHSLCDNKRGIHLALSLERLEERVAANNLTPLQRIGCSATMNPLEEIARYLVGYDDNRAERPCEIIDAGAGNQYDIRVEVPVSEFLSTNNTSLWNSAFEILTKEINAHDTTLVFCNSRYRAEKTALLLGEMAKENRHVGVHHGSMAKEVRFETEERLKNGELKALVATSSLELGIDVGAVNLVYHLESPKTVASGLQRVGRAGHLLDATSKGRILIFDRDELAEAAVICRAMLDGEVDSVRIPRGSIDVLSQQIAGIVSVRQYGVDELYRIVCRAYPYAGLRRGTFERALQMLSGDIELNMSYPPRALVLWDRNAALLSPNRGASHITNMNVGTIEDASEYEVVIEKSGKRIGRIEADFVDDSLRTGEVFALGNSSWRVKGKRKNQVLVEEAPGSTPTVPWWMGGVVSRSEEVGRMIGLLRREVTIRTERNACVTWLMAEYHLCANGAEALYQYVRSQQLSCGIVPDHEHILAEFWCDELGNIHIILHCPLGARINRTWGLALSQAALENRGETWSITSTNDIVLLSLKSEPVGHDRISDPNDLLDLVNPENLDYYIVKGIELTGGTKFRAVATCALQILRAKDGKRIPVWLQNHRAQELFEAAEDTLEYPLFDELKTLIEEETLDVAGCNRLLALVRDGAADVVCLVSKRPTPFSHNLLVKSRYTEAGHQMGRARRAELLKLHQKMLEEILTSEEIAGILDQRAIEKLEAQLLRQTDETRLESPDELAHAISELGDVAADMKVIGEMVRENHFVYLKKLVAENRIVAIRVPNCEEFPMRFVTSDMWRLYADAFYGGIGVSIGKPDTSREAKRVLIPVFQDASDPVNGEKQGIAENTPRYGSITGYEVRDPTDVIDTQWLVPWNRDAARREVLRLFFRRSGPVAFNEIIDYSGWTPAVVSPLLNELCLAGIVDSGVYTSAKPKPQWIYRGNLERVHRMTLRYLRRELAACAPYEVVDFMTRWQHVHPDSRLTGVEGVRTVIRQLQGLESLQGYLEPDILAGRIRDYTPDMLDSLIASGEVRWARIGVGGIKRGRISLCMREDLSWLSSGAPMRYNLNTIADEDIPEVIAATRSYFAANGTAYFDDIVGELGVEEGYVLRAIWHLAWTGEITCDTYACLRSANFTSTLSACYDLGSTPKKILRGVTTSAAVVDRMNRRGLDPRKGRWSSLPRLNTEGSDPVDVATVRRWAEQLLLRWGVVTKDIIAVESAAPTWNALNKEYKRLELLGRVQRGYFIESHYGTQYGLPEAIELLRECRARRSDGKELGYLDGEKVFSMSGHDPANLYIRSLEILDDRGVPIHRTIRSGNVHIRFALQAGQVMLFAGGQPANVRLLAEMDRRRLQINLRALVSKPNGGTSPLSISAWNGHAIDVSPVSRFLWDEEFRFNAKREMVFPPGAVAGTEPSVIDLDVFKPIILRNHPSSTTKHMRSLDRTRESSQNCLSFLSLLRNSYPIHVRTGIGFLL